MKDETAILTPEGPIQASGKIHLSVDEITRLYEAIQKKELSNNDNGSGVTDEMYRIAVDRARRLILVWDRRDRFFPREAFGDPAWQILVYIFVRDAELDGTSVSAACSAAGTPTSTALRYINWLTKSGMIRRLPDQSDHRRFFLQLMPETRDKLAELLFRWG